MPFRLPQWSSDCFSSPTAAINHKHPPVNQAMEVEEKQSTDSSAEKSPVEATKQEECPSAKASEEKDDIQKSGMITKVEETKEETAELTGATKEHTPSVESAKTQPPKPSPYQAQKTKIQTDAKDFVMEETGGHTEPEAEETGGHTEPEADPLVLEHPVIQNWDPVRLICMLLFFHASKDLLTWRYQLLNSAC